MATTHRPDIDGLRAVAVIPVVLFHAFPARMPGGFAGVDVFFVISGFLISSVLVGGLADGSFRFVDFYVRRVRRIFPALLLVLVTSLVAGWLLLFTDEFAQLAGHVAGGAGFVSNFVLWSEIGYFDNDAATKPLLHLWSLGIEEQFYIAWPLLLWLAWRAGLAPGGMVGLLFAASLAFCLGVADPVEGFYSPFSRAIAPFFRALAQGELRDTVVVIAARYSDHVAHVAAASVLAPAAGGDAQPSAGSRDAAAVFEAGLRETLARAVPGSRAVVFAHEVPGFREDPRLCVPRWLRVRPASACRIDRARVESGQRAYRDGNHLGPRGAEVFSRALVARLPAALRPVSGASRPR